MEEFVILSIPFLGTTLGAATVFLMKVKMNPRLEKLLLGFAAGVMVAASVWSLLIPAIELAEDKGGNAWLPAAAGVLLGVGSLLCLDSLISHVRRVNVKSEDKSDLQRTIMLVLAVALHNLPEGMAVGVAFAGAILEGTGMTMAGALVLAIGIAIQNFPEGAIISMPLRNTGISRPKAFWYGVLSGAVEPVGAVLTIFLAEQIVSVLPYFLAFAAGAMIYVVVKELIPEAEAGEHTAVGTIGVTAGFVLMMVLDVALG